MFGKNKKDDIIKSYKKEQLKKTIQLINRTLDERKKAKGGSDAFDIVCGITDLAVELGLMDELDAKEYIDKATAIDIERVQRAKAEKEEKKAFEKAYKEAETQEEKDKLLADYRKKSGIDK